eukprot:15461263-Alexandrium_andersonii.AAC.1
MACGGRMVACATVGVKGFSDVEEEGSCGMLEGVCGKVLGGIECGGGVKCAVVWDAAVLR